MLIGIVLFAAGAVGLYAFRDVTPSYSVELVGSGPDAGRLLQVDCHGGQATGRLAGDERAERECALEEDDAKTTRLVQLAGSGLVGFAGLVMAASGFRRWRRAFRSLRSYRRMVKDHAEPSQRSRWRR